MTIRDTEPSRPVRRPSGIRRAPKLDDRFHFSFELAPMGASSAERLPRSNGQWQYEPKWDGFRCLAIKMRDIVELRGRSGKSMSRYFPEVVETLRGLSAKRFVIDGELMIEIEGHFAFDALQTRLHPAESRIRNLSVETPARLVVFDMLMAPSGLVIVDRPLQQRRQLLEAFAAGAGIPGKLMISPATHDLAVAEKWLSEAGGGATDGVIAKRLMGRYEPAERTMIKVKRLRTADCVIGGFRYLSGTREVGSLLLGLYDEHGELDHVGFTSTITESERQPLTKRLEALREPPGFTGRRPGGPSRWSVGRSAEWEPVRPELVVEVRFDQLAGDRFRHGTKLMRWRPDKEPRQCTFVQVSPPLQNPNQSAP